MTTFKGKKFSGLNFPVFFPTDHTTRWKSVARNKYVSKVLIILLFITRVFYDGFLYFTPVLFIVVFAMWGKKKKIN